MKILSTIFTISIACSAETGFAEILKMEPPGTETEPQIIGKDTKKANPNEWPATVVFRNIEGGGCTATAVGERVIITAAHCVANGAKAMVQLNKTGSTREITCTHHPKYPESIVTDFALCFASEPLPTANRFEVISTEKDLAKVGSELVLLGYGCRTVGGNDRAFGNLYEGVAKVTHHSNNEYLVTYGGAAVCFGDSGGGSFAFTAPDKIKRRLVAINSRGDININSWLSPTSNSSFLTWAKEWQKETGAEICGIDQGAKNCRQ